VALTEVEPPVEVAVTEETLATPPFPPVPLVPPAPPNGEPAVPASLVDASTPFVELLAPPPPPAAMSGTIKPV